MEAQASASADLDEKGTAQVPESDAEKVDTKLALTAELEAVRGQLLLAKADMENLKKRTDRKVEHAHAYGIEHFARNMIQVADDLERAVSASNVASDSTLLDGVRMTLKKLEDAFAQHGLQPIQPDGCAFDPSQHEAVAVEAHLQAPKDQVIRVLQRGWVLRDRVLRSATVAVSSGQPPAVATDKKTPDAAS